MEVKMDATKALKLIAGIEKRLRNDSSAMKNIAYRGYKGVIKNFKDEMGPRGHWAPDKPATLRARSKRSNNKRKSSSIAILKDTGKLRGSIIRKYMKHSAEISTDLEYAAVHQKGFREKNIPARPYMWLNDKAVDLINKYYARWISRGV